MDQFSHTLVPFPLLSSPSDYFPDTQDLTVDTDAREYWLSCFEDGLEKVSFLHFELIQFSSLPSLLVKQWTTHSLHLPFASSDNFC